MEIRSGAELGLKMINHGETVKFKPKENPANLPGKDLENSQFEQIEREMNATRPSQTKEAYIINGGSVNLQA